MTPRKKSSVSVYEFDSYREYLRAYYNERKQNDPTFSYRAFAKRAGNIAPNYLKLVIDGKRNLTPAMAEKFSKGLKLNPDETEFLRNLISMNHAKTDKQRNLFYQKLRADRMYKRYRRVESHQYDYYSAWYNVALRELVSLPSFKEDETWIANRLDPPISPRQVKQAFQKMLELGILDRDAEGHLTQSAPIITTGNEVRSLMVKNLHREMMARAAESMERQPPEHRHITGMSVAISHRQAEEIKRRIIQFGKEILDLVQEDDPPEEVYRMNIQWFMLTSPHGAGGKS